MKESRYYFIIAILILILIASGCKDDIGTKGIERNPEWVQCAGEVRGAVVLFAASCDIDFKPATSERFAGCIHELKGRAKQVSERHRKSSSFKRYRAGIRPFRT